MQSTVALTALLSNADGTPSVRAEEQDGTVSLQVEKSKLRAAPQVWAKAVSDLHYGDVLTVQSRDRGWLLVATAQSTTGYVHESAVTRKAILLKSVAASLSDLSVEESDVYLAGKGFNASTEALLSQKDSTLNYGAVDKMVDAARGVEPAMADFISAGSFSNG